MSDVMPPRLKHNGTFRTMSSSIALDPSRDTPNRRRDDGPAHRARVLTQKNCNIPLTVYPERQFSVGSGPLLGENHIRPPSCRRTFPTKNNKDAMTMPSPHPPPAGRAASPSWANVTLLSVLDRQSPYMYRSRCFERDESRSCAYAGPPIRPRGPRTALHVQTRHIGVQV